MLLALFALALKPLLALQPSVFFEPQRMRSANRQGMWDFEGAANTLEKEDFSFDIPFELLEATSTLVDGNAVYRKDKTLMVEGALIDGDVDVFRYAKADSEPHLMVGYTMVPWCHVNRDFYPTIALIGPLNSTTATGDAVFREVTEDDDFPFDTPEGYGVLIATQAQSDDRPTYYAAQGRNKWFLPEGVHGDHCINSIQKQAAEFRLRRELQAVEPAGDGLSCIYTNPYSALPQCREYAVASWTVGGAETACESAWDDGNFVLPGNFSQEVCSFHAASDYLASCIYPDDTVVEFVGPTLGCSIIADTCLYIQGGVLSTEQGLCDGIVAVPINPNYVLQAEAYAGMVSTATVTVSPDSCDRTCLDDFAASSGYVTFTPVTVVASVGIIFYPGAGVDSRAYSPLLQLIADMGYRVFLVPLPTTPMAGVVIQENPSIEHWVLGGHSRGGTTAAAFIFNNPGVIAAYFGLAGFPSSYTSLHDHSLYASLVYGSLEAVASYAESLRTVLPADLTELVSIEGGDHSFFAYSGLLEGDVPAEITQAEQVARAADEVGLLVDRMLAGLNGGCDDGLVLAFKVGDPVYGASATQCSQFCTPAFTVDLIGASQGRCSQIGFDELDGHTQVQVAGAPGTVEVIDVTLFKEASTACASGTVRMYTIGDSDFALAADQCGEFCGVSFLPYPLGDCVGASYDQFIEELVVQPVGAPVPVTLSIYEQLSVCPDGTVQVHAIADATYGANAGECAQFCIPAFAMGALIPSSCTAVGYEQFDRQVTIQSGPPSSPISVAVDIYLVEGSCPSGFLRVSTIGNSLFGATEGVCSQFCQPAFAPLPSGAVALACEPQGFTRFLQDAVVLVPTGPSSSVEVDVSLYALAHGACPTGQVIISYLGEASYGANPDQCSQLCVETGEVSTHTGLGGSTDTCASQLFGEFSTTQQVATLSFPVVSIFDPTDCGEGLEMIRVVGNPDFGVGPNECAQTCIPVLLVLFVFASIGDVGRCAVDGYPTYLRADNVQPEGAPVAFDVFIYGRLPCPDPSLVTTFIKGVSAYGSGPFQCSQLCAPSFTVGLVDGLELGICLQDGYSITNGTYSMIVPGSPNATDVIVYERPPPAACSLTCSGHGTCVTKTVSPLDVRPYCVCEAGWMTKDCSKEHISHLRAVPSKTRFTLVIKESFTHYLTPGLPLDYGDIPYEMRRSSLLVNGTYPGPTLVVDEGTDVEILIINQMHDSASGTSIHWHGQNQRGTPWMDGAFPLTQCAIGTGSNFTYKFRTDPAGTHWYHSHMGVQRAMGLQGGFIVRKPNDPNAHMYQDELLVQLSDWSFDPLVSWFSDKQGVIGNFAAREMEMGLINGISGNGTAEFPYPQIEVEAGVCYRMRFLNNAGNAMAFNVSFAGHQLTVISYDGRDVTPMVVSMFTIEQAARVDVILCADQPPGNYLMHMQYTMNCGASGGFRSPVCDYYGYLKYSTDNEPPTDLFGTGGGRTPVEVPEVILDSTKPNDLTSMEPSDIGDVEPDVVFTTFIGFNEERDQWYLSPTKGAWVAPKSPPLHTEAECGSEDNDYLVVPPEAEIVEIRINNLSPASHPLHLHGQFFEVLAQKDENDSGAEDFSFTTAYPDAPCGEDAELADGPAMNEYEVGGGSLWWGCTYNQTKHSSLLNRVNPAKRDVVMVWRRSWTVIRFRADNPGVWFFHCHVLTHLHNGLVNAVTVRPKQVGTLPWEIPTCGPCEVALNRAYNEQHCTLPEPPACDDGEVQVSITGTTDYGATLEQCVELCLPTFAVAFVPEAVMGPCSAQDFVVFVEQKVVTPVGSPFPVQVSVYGPRPPCAEGQTLLSSAGPDGYGGWHGDGQCSEFCANDAVVLALDGTDAAPCKAKGFTHFASSIEAPYFGEVKLFDAPSCGTDLVMRWLNGSTSYGATHAGECSQFCMPSFLPFPGAGEGTCESGGYADYARTVTVMPLGSPFPIEVQVWSQDSSGPDDDGAECSWDNAIVTEVSSPGDYYFAVWDPEQKKKKKKDAPEQLDYTLMTGSLDMTDHLDIRYATQLSGFLDHGASLSNLCMPPDSVIMCDKKGKKEELVKPEKIEKKLKQGWTFGACEDEDNSAAIAGGVGAACAVIGAVVAGAVLKNRKNKRDQLKKRLSSMTEHSRGPASRNSISHRSSHGHGRGAGSGHSRPRASSNGSNVQLHNRAASPLFRSRIATLGEVSYPDCDRPSDLLQVPRSSAFRQSDTSQSPKSFVSRRASESAISPLGMPATTPTQKPIRNTLAAKGAHLPPLDLTAGAKDSGGDVVSL